jgi:hypothetical protein
MDPSQLRTGYERLLLDGLVASLKSEEETTERKELRGEK